MKKINWINHFLNFVAVILGVFLAFYVSARAESAKERVELREIVQSLVKDLEADLNTYETYQIPANVAQYEAIGRLIESILGSEADSIENQLSASMTVENFSPSSATYLSITTSGKINLIDDLETKKALSIYYDQLSEEAFKKGEVQADFFLNEILPWMIENTNMMDVQSAEMVGNIQLANRLAIYSTLIENKVDQYKMISTSSGNLKTRLLALIE